MLTASSLKDFNENIVQLTQDESCTDSSYSTYPLVLSQNEYKINECDDGPLAVYDDFKTNLFNKIFTETSNTNSHSKFYLILSLVFLFLFLINQFFYDRLKYLTARKKNISLLLIIILFSKVLAHYLLYPMQENLGIHFDNLFLKELWLFIPVSLAMIFIAWFFNDKIKAR